MTRSRQTDAVPLRPFCGHANYRTDENRAARGAPPRRVCDAGDSRTRRAQHGSFLLYLHVAGHHSDAAIYVVDARDRIVDVLR